MKLTKNTHLLFFLFILSLIACQKPAKHPSVALNGEWELCLDSLNGSLEGLHFNLALTLPEPG